MANMHLLTIDWWYILEKFLLVGFVVSMALLIAMYTTYAERKIAAFMQDRRGPNRAGPFGILPGSFALLSVMSYLRALAARDISADPAAAGDNILLSFAKPPDV